MRRLVLVPLTAVLLAAAPSPAQAASCPGQDVVPTAATAATAKRATLCLLNRERTSRGLRPLAAQRTLRAVATRYARRMVRQDFFSHVGPSGDTLRQRVKRTSYLRGVRRWTVGENLAYGTGSHATPAQIVKGWMASPGHRRNLLRRSYRDIGLGLALGAPRTSRAGATYVTNFGTRRR